MAHLWSKRVFVNAQGEKNEPAPLDPAYLVKWEPNDPSNPQNWSVAYKWWITFHLGMLALVGSLGSSITIPGDSMIAKYVGVSQEVAILDVTLYL